MNHLDIIENSIEHARSRIAKAEAVTRLFNNTDFNEVLVKGYIEKEAVRLVGLYGSGRLPEEMRVDVERDMHAIGAFESYLQRTITDGHTAVSDLETAQQNRDEYIAEYQSGELDEDEESDTNYRGLGA